MRKRNFLKTISSIIACLAITGFSVLGFISNRKNKSQYVLATSSVITLDSSNFDWDTPANYNNTQGVWSYLISLLDFNPDYNANPTWSSYVDFDIKGYVRGYPFEKIRIAYGQVVSSVPQLFGAYEQYFRFYYGTAFEFSQAEYGGFDLRQNANYVRYASDLNTWFITIAGNYAGSFNFVGGTDSINSDLLFIVNSLLTFTGYNTYTYDDITKDDYENMLLELNRQIDTLNSEIDNLKVNISTAYDSGYQEGYTIAENIGITNTQNAYQEGYTNGYNEGFNSDSTVTSIFSGILQVGLVPVNFFLSIFNFEVLGVNLSAFIRAIFTVVLTIIVIKTVTGKGGGGSDN